MDTEKMLVQGGAAAGTAVLAELVEKKKWLGTTVSGGLVTSLATAALAYFMAPTARGNMIPALTGVVDGSAAYLALRYVGPMIPSTGYHRVVAMPAPVGAFGGRGIEI